MGLRGYWTVKGLKWKADTCYNITAHTAVS